MPNDDEIKALLREIRDLQQAHNQRYQQFTQAVLDNNAQASLQIAQDTNRAITANRRANWTHIYSIMACTLLLIVCFLLRRT